MKNQPRTVTMSRRSLAQIHSHKRTTKKWNVIEAVLRMEHEMKVFGINLKP